MQPVGGQPIPGFDEAPDHRGPAIAAAQEEGQLTVPNPTPHHAQDVTASTTVQRA